MKGGEPILTTFISPVNRLPYQLLSGVDGWQYTARNGEEVDEPDLWQELDLPDFNVVIAGQLVSELRGDWSLAGPTAMPAGTPKPDLTGTSVMAAERPSPPRRTYWDKVGCEFGKTYKAADFWGPMNAAPFIFAAQGNEPRAWAALAVAGFSDVAGAWAIRASCAQ